MKNLKEKNKKLVIISIVFITILLLLGGFNIYKNFILVDDGDKPGDVTVSKSKIYEETTDVNHTAAIYSLAYTDVATEGDNVQVNSNSKGFKFVCHGLDTSKKLYVFIDGDINNPVGEFKPDNWLYSNKVSFDGSFMKEGEHTIQFVQFDGGTPTFCKTRHFIVKN